MKIKDISAVGFIVLAAAFFILPATMAAYERAYYFSPEFVSFIKFALLATFGEMAGARIRTGNYYSSDFGLLPKAVIWGLLGAAISVAFRIFSAGVGSFGLFNNIAGFPAAVLKAFMISVFMNIFFAPVMMLAHKITDQHIADGGGRFSLTSFKVTEILRKLDWEQYWSFLVKKTIPFFWIPAHTITFLLPEEFRTLFAALLSIFLGIFLSLSSRRSGRHLETFNSLSGLGPEAGGIG